MPFLSFFHGLHAGTFRKAAKVPYPQLYATPTQTSKEESPNTAAAAHQYNCAQRAHANYMENMPQTMVMLLVAGLKWPLAATGLGVAWLAFRGLYAWGYIYGTKPKGGSRTMGSMFWLCQAGLWGMCATMGVNLITKGAI